MKPVRSEVGRYYATIALINLGLGVATCAAMTLLRMPNPILCGVLAGTLSLIPCVGSATTLVVLGIVAFGSFDGVAQVLAVTGTYLALTIIGGQIVQPLFVGLRLELNPIVVFLALWVGGAVLGNCWIDGREDGKSYCGGTVLHLRLASQARARPELLYFQAKKTPARSWA